MFVQVRFPEILSIAKTEFIADFRERIRADYPLHKLSQDPFFELNNDGMKMGVTRNWRFLDKSKQWCVSLTTGFVSLETRFYQSRLDINERTHTIVHALSATIKPGMTTRIGVRYVEQLHGP